MPPFYPLRPRYMRSAGLHEAGHAAATLDLLGPGNIRNIEFRRIWYHLHRACDADKLVILAAGFCATDLFGHGRYGLRNDVTDATRIWPRMPRGVLEWKEALVRAKQLVAKRRAFIEELGSRLEREPYEISGAEVDKMWLRFYPAPVSHERRVPLSALPPRRDDEEPDLETKAYDAAGQLIGLIRRQPSSGRYVGTVFGISSRKVNAPSRDAAELALRRLVSEQKLRWRTDGVLGA